MLCGLHAGEVCSHSLSILRSIKLLGQLRQNSDSCSARRVLPAASAIALTPAVSEEIPARLCFILQFSKRRIEAICNWQERILLVAQDVYCSGLLGCMQEPLLRLGKQAFFR